MGLFVIELAAARFVLNDSSLLVESRSILPPQGVFEEVVVDVVEHTLTKNFKKILRYLRSSRFSILAARYGK
jgi:hypothetical protein